MSRGGATQAGLTARKWARMFVGIAESPPGSNRGPYIDRWNLAAGVPAGSEWCMSFMHAMFLTAGRYLGGGASVGNFQAWAVAKGYALSRPWAGCLVCFEWETDSWPDHVGIVDRVLALRFFGGRFVGWVRTIEGNTGDAVRVRWRWISRPNTPGSASFASIP